MVDGAMQERRSSIRVEPATDQAIRVDVNGENFIDIFDAVDISTGGLALEVPHRFLGCQVDALVECVVKLPFPVTQYIHAQGRITHISGNRFGLAFYNLNENAEELIEEYVCYCLRSQSLLVWAAHKLGFDALISY